MKFIKHLWKKYATRELLVYGVVGVLTTVVNWVVCFILNNLLKVESSALVNSIAWVAAVAFAYVMSNIYVFQMKYEGAKNESIKVGKFVLSRVATGAIEIGGMFLLDDMFGLPFWPVKIIISVIVILLNYVFSKVFVFIKKKGV